ncbi:30S processome protein Utp24 [Candidatus Bathyarchaeota archaeon B24-2]|nr:MAG: 30S processome protein Utp24 [Candidatus Bathyarchaeota archaeon B24-2]
MVKKRSMLRVIFDSNFFFLPGKFNLDPFEEISRITGRKVEPIVLSVSLKEIDRLARHGSPKERSDASLALKFARLCRVMEVEKGEGESVDDVILRVASEDRTPVATNDGVLRKKLRKRGIPVIYLREKSKLEVDGAV